MKIPAVFYRGGSSKALLFKKDDLPSDRSQWDALFLAALGSPDPLARQLDGMGGGISSLSKVGILSASNAADYDVEYTFVQVGVKDRKVDYKGNCGNIVSAVGPFAIQQGWLGAVPDGEVTVRILNTNTQKIILSKFLVKNSQPVFDGDFTIPGVSGQGAPIRLIFLNPGGASTGRLLPTSQAQELLEVEGVGSVMASLVDAANATVFLKAEHFDLKGNESAEELEMNKALLEKLEKIRCAASVAMGITPHLEAAAKSLSVPYVALISAAQSFVSSDHERFGADEMDFSMRVIASGQAHKALPLTVSLCAGVAARIPGSIVNEAMSYHGADSSLIRLGMPSGVLAVDAEVVQKEGQYFAESGSFYRTARPLFEGLVWVPQLDKY